MYDQRLFIKALSDFTQHLLTPYDVDTALQELADSLTEVLGLVGGGVSLADEGRLSFNTAYGSGIVELEQAQDEFQSGPCVSAFQSGEAIAVPDLALEASRWPEYSKVAAKVGINAVTAIPLRLGDQVIGALNLFARDAREWPDEDLEAARVVADMASVYLINASYHDTQVDVNQHLVKALASRAIIEQAKGMISVQNTISQSQAFNELRSYARSRNATVQAVAHAVVNLGLKI